MFETFSIDLGKDGLETLFTPWQVEAMKLLWGGHEYKSGEMHAALNAKGIDISRASVIMFLDRMTSEGVLAYREATGKGGHHRIYRAALTEDDLWGGVASAFSVKLVEAKKGGK